MKISIDSNLKQICSDVSLGVIVYSARVEDSSPELSDLMDDTIEKLSKKYTMPDIARISHISSTRNAYKALGKSPSEYRNASEAMLRRIVKGNGLYRINNVIEINNLISITSGYSVGSYDRDCICGEVELRRAFDGEKYQGIGKAFVNIEHLPVLYDSQGPFGNPTSDSTRAMIKNDSQNIMSVVYSFDGKKELNELLDRYSELLRTYCSADNFDVVII